MAEPKYDKLEIVGLHEPDSSWDTNADGNKEKTDLPGLYTLGVMVGGKFMPFHSYKAGNLVDKKNKVSVGAKGSSKTDESSDDSTDES